MFLSFSVATTFLDPHTHTHARTPPGPYTSKTLLGNCYAYLESSLVSLSSRSRSLCMQLKNILFLSFASFRCFILASSGRLLLLLVIEQLLQLKSVKFPNNILPKMLPPIALWHVLPKDFEYFWYLQGSNGVSSANWRCFGQSSNMADIAFGIFDIAYTPSETTDY